jgi:nucleoside-diphosphate kinase
MEKTCLIVKPDGVGKKLVGEIIKRLESETLKLVGIKMVQPGKSEIETFYEMHRGKPFFEPLVHFMLAGPVVVTVWEGVGAVACVRRLIGATNSKEAAHDTLRGQFGTDNRRNLVHASDSYENAQREILFFFKRDEMFEYSEKEWENR